MVGYKIVDVSILNSSSIKIRFRRAVFVVDPSSEGGKTICDAIVLLNGENSDLSKVSDYRIVINGPGEYEISGVKISGISIDNGFVYNIIGDGVAIILGRTKEISKISAQGGKEFSTECQIAILNADSEFAESVVTGLESKVVVLYGDNRVSGAKTMGQKNPNLSKKLTLSKDKLPEGMEVVVLG